MNDNGKKIHTINGVEVTEAWLRVISYCANRLPFGEITIKIVNSNPTDLLQAKVAYRFDKPWNSPEFPLPEPENMKISDS